MVYCDKCNFEFKLNHKVEDVDGDIHRHYIRCPKCKTEYHGFYTDTNTRELYEKFLETNLERDKRKYVQALKTLNFDGESKH